jgi:hypothetical protein
MMTLGGAALSLHESEPRIAFYYPRIVDNATGARVGEGLALRRAAGLSDPLADPGEPGTVIGDESPGGEA